MVMLEEKILNRRPDCGTGTGGTAIAQYKCAGHGYRITETYPQGGNTIAAGTVNNIYYDSSWQAIETRTDGTASSNVTSQTVWSAAYTNAVVLQDTYSAGVIQPNSRLYFLQDANWNTTAIAGLSRSSWQVIQRYVYSPYGTVTTLDAGWMPQGTPPGISNLYQGMTLDPVTGLYYARNRNYSPSLGRWINQDPAGFINGANTYQFVMSNPVNAVDPWGLENHHIIPRAIWSPGSRSDPITFSSEAQKVFEDGVIDAPYHHGYKNPHRVYSAEVCKEVEKYLEDHGICPTEMDMQQAKDLLSAIKHSDNKIVKGFLKGITTAPSILERLLQGLDAIPSIIFVPNQFFHWMMPGPANQGPPPPTA